MSYYRECPNCGAHLDPGEHCDCEGKPSMESKRSPVAKIKRHTTTDLFNETLAAARAAGLLTELDAILDYAEPARDAKPISDFEFDVLFQLRFGRCEGIYLNASIWGVWQEGGSDSQQSIGTIKTLREDMAAMLIMGQAAGALTWWARDCINSNLNDFAPAATLARWKQQREERAAAQEAQKNADGN